MLLRVSAVWSWQHTCCGFVWQQAAGLQCAGQSKPGICPISMELQHQVALHGLAVSKLWYGKLQTCAAPDQDQQEQQD